jgi:predicted ester cyclase
VNVASDDGRTTVSESKRVVERHIEAWNARDEQADPWSADAASIVPAGELHGREQMLAFQQAFWSGFPDARLTLVRLITEGDTAAAEGLLSGTQTGPFPVPGGELPPTGRAVEMRWSAVYETRGDELTSEHLYFDQVDFLSQLGHAAPS